MDVKVIEPATCCKQFSNIDEFNAFYAKNQEEMNKLTTQKLNKMYTVPGYHITRVKNIPGLSLKKWTGSRYIKNDQMETFQQCLDLVNNVHALEETMSTQYEEFQNFVSDFNEIVSSMTHDIDEANKACQSITSLADSVKKQHETVNETLATFKKQLDAVATYPKLKDHVRLIDKDLDTIQEQLKTLYDTVKDGRSQF
jgi:methyl-accepting chemotaxis protein